MAAQDILPPAAAPPPPVLEIQAPVADIPQGPGLPPPPVVEEHPAAAAAVLHEPVVQVITSLSFISSIACNP